MAVKGAEAKHVVKEDDSAANAEQNGEAIKEMDYEIVVLARKSESVGPVLYWLLRLFLADCLMELMGELLTESATIIDYEMFWKNNSLRWMMKLYWVLLVMKLDKMVEGWLWVMLRVTQLAWKKH